MLHTVIMAGGSGTRFWPASRKSYPKQFLKLQGDQSLIQQTALRCDAITSRGQQTWVVTGAAHAETTAEQLPEIPARRILAEPCARNTAPCIGLAAACILAEDPDAVMLVTPSDHIISPDDAFISAVQQAVSTIEKYPDQLCTFGIPPDRPATGFGYIEPGSRLTDCDHAVSVRQFREKPDAETASGFVAAGFLWNSGIFVWRADTILNYLMEFEPEIGRCLTPVRDSWAGPDFEASLERHFPDMPSISIDCAVLERTSQACVIWAPFRWDDAGSWSALPRLNSPDSAGNTVRGTACSIDTRDCNVYSSENHLIATIGLEDCLIVHTPQATLVAKIDDDTQVQALLKKMESAGLSEYL